MKTITMTVSKKGKVTIETSGFQGSSCQEATKSLESKLGVSQNETIQPEYYENDNSQVQSQ